MAGKCARAGRGHRARHDSRRRACVCGIAAALGVGQNPAARRPFLATGPLPRSQRRGTTPSMPPCAITSSRRSRRRAAGSRDRARRRASRRQPAHAPRPHATGIRWREFRAPGRAQPVATASVPPGDSVGVRGRHAPAHRDCAPRHARPDRRGARSGGTARREPAHAPRPHAASGDRLAAVPRLGGADPPRSLLHRGSNWRTFGSDATDTFSRLTSKRQSLDTAGSALTGRHQPAARKTPTCFCLSRVHVHLLSAWFSAGTGYS